MNAIPLISRFRATPDDYYLLRVGFGGLSGPLSNIDQGGFAAASFHSFADTLKWDGYSGDYGPNFVGHTLEMGTYIVEHSDFGWQAFGGNVVSKSPTVRVQTLDSVRRRVFVAPLGAWLTLDAGAFSEVEIDPSERTVRLTITPSAGGVSGAASAPEARLLVQNTASNGLGVLEPTTSLAQDAGAWVIPFRSGVASVTLGL